MVKLRRLVSILVTLALVFTILPAAAFADEETPAASPSATVSEEPGASPSPSGEPGPTMSPSEEPGASASPSEQPSASPSAEPSASPSEQPSASPSEQPSASPSEQPSASPSVEPGASPSGQAGPALMQSMVMEPMAKYTLNVSAGAHGKLNNNVSGTKYNSGTKLNLTNLTQPEGTTPGYRFDHWENKGLIGWDICSADIEISFWNSNNYRAVFDNHYTLSFDTSGGPSVDPQSVEYNSTVTLPIPTWAGHEFAGWYTDSGCTASAGTSYTVTKDTTLYAKWNVTYKIDTEWVGTGSGSIDPSVTVYAGTDATISYNPNPGSGVYYVKVDGSYVDTTVYGASYTFQNIQGNHRIQVYFAHEVPGISATSYSGPYDGYPHTISVQDNNLTSWLDTITYSTDGVNYNLSSAPAFTDAGVHTVYFKVEKQIIGIDVFAPYYGSATVTITPVTLTVTADPVMLTYGDAAPATDTVKYTGFVNGENQSVISGTPGFSTNYTPVSPAGGSYTITPTPGTLNAANYSFSFAPGTVTVGKAALTVKADNKPMKYGDPVPAYTYTISGYKNGEDGSTAGIAGSAVCGCSYTTTTPVGSYPITFTTQNLSAANYTFSYQAGTLTVNEANTPSITVGDTTVTYDGQPHTLTVSGIQEGDQILYSATGTDGSYSASPITFTNVTAPTPVFVKVIRPNFAPFIGSANVTVNPAALTVGADDISLTYGDDAPTAGTVKYSGFVNGENQTVLGGTLSFTTTYSKGSPAGGSYTITPQGLTSGNYHISFIPGTVMVEKAALTVTADDISLTYGDDAPATDTVKYSGFVNGENQTALGGTLSFTTTYSKGSPAGGSYTITPLGLVSQNYTINFAAGTVTAGKADLTVTANDKSVTYGNDAPAYDVNYLGFVAGDDASDLQGMLAFNCSYTAGSDTGAYTITPKGLISGNYNITFADGTLTVSKANLAVTADNKSVTYGGAAPAYTVSYSGFAAGDDKNDLQGALTLDCSYAAGDAAGDYQITAGGLTSGNYSISFLPGTLTVNKAPLTIAAADKSVTYGDAAPAYNVTYTGFVLGDTSGSLTGKLATDCSYKAMNPAGAYQITPSGLTSGNYTITFVPGTLTVGQAKLTVKADNKFITIGDSAPAYTVTYSGFVGNENVSSLGGALIIACSYTPGNPSGSYDIKPGGLTSANYAITFVPGTLAVAPLNQYSVLFLDYDGTLLKAEWVTQNGNATPPANPARAGYTFSGWQGSYTNITANTTVTAGYTIRTFTLAVAIEGNGTVTGIGGTYNYGDVVDLGGATVTPGDGYEFYGFEDSDGNPVTSVTVTANTTVRAVFNEIAAVPLASPAPSASPSPSQTTEIISENETPEAAPEIEGQQGLPLWAWILIGAGVAGFLFWLFFLLWKRRKEQEDR